MLRAIYGSEEQGRPTWPRPDGGDDHHDHVALPAGGLHLHDRPDLRGQGGDLADHVQDQGGVLQELHAAGGGGEETIAVKKGEMRVTTSELITMDDIQLVTVDDTMGDSRALVNFAIDFVQP